MRRSHLLWPALGILLAAAAVADVQRSSFKPIRDRDWDRAAAAHLLRRAGFGGTASEVDRLVTMTIEQAVAHLVDYDREPYPCAPPLISAELEQPPDRAALRDLTEEERLRRINERRKLERDAFEQTRLWWIERLVESPRPFEEKMTLFWHGHFTSGIREVRNPIFIKEQNEFLRRNALASFRDLVLGISRDRAMLVYLDGARNNKKQPNENYARELMELFTLGVGNYTEKDIQQAARAFTGWAFDGFGFVFHARNHDYGDKSFLSRKGRFNGDDIVEIILEQPACSRFLAKNLLEFFCRPDPDRKTVEAFAREIRRHKFELRPIMKTLFTSQAFYHPDSRGCLIKGPAELLVGSARALGVPIENLRTAERAMAAMGQELLQPPNVKGWDGGKAWINTATLYNRYNILAGLINGVSPGRDSDRPDAEDPSTAGSPTMINGRIAPKSRLNGDRQPPFDPMPIVHDNRLRTAEDIVKYFVGHLLAVPLSGAKREQLIAYLDDDGRFAPNQPGAAARIRTVITLICSTPEYQLY